MIPEKAYAIALWRLKKHGVPDRMDWLHEAIVDYLTNAPTVEIKRLGNWLGLVAWRKFYDHQKKWTSRRIKAVDRLTVAGKQEAEQDDDLISELSTILSERDWMVFRLWLEGKNIPQTARGIGLSTSRVQQIRARIRELADGLSADCREHGNGPR